MIEELKRLKRSFRQAFAGFKHCVKTERNFRLHIVTVGCVLYVSPLAELVSHEYIILLICFALVISSELLNTGIEILCNMNSKSYNTQIKHAKDITAAGVLVSAILSVAIGMIIFVPKMAIISRNFTIIHAFCSVILVLVGLVFVFRRRK